MTGNIGFAARRDPGRIEFANGLRGLAALLVLLAHYCGLFWYSRLVISQLTGFAPLSSAYATPASVTRLNAAIAPVLTGPLGVAIFFLISGFVIPFGFQSQDRRQFFTARVLRLWPTYGCGFLLGIAVTVLAAHWAGHSFAPGWAAVARHAVLGMREITAQPSLDGVIWTLETEVWFYLAVAWAGPKYVRPGSLLTFLAPALIFLAVCLVRWLSGLSSAEVLSTGRFFAFYGPFVIFIFVGVALNFFYRGLMDAKRTTLTLIVLLGASAWALGLTQGWRVLTYQAPSYAAGLFIFLAAMAFARARIWTSPPLRFFARISFSLYAVHPLTGFVILNLLVRQGVDPNLAILMAFAAAIMLAWALHRAVEQPAHDWGRKLSRSALRPLPTVPGAADPLPQQSH